MSGFPLGVRVVAGSNPAAPTNPNSSINQAFWPFFSLRPARSNSLTVETFVGTRQTVHCSLPWTAQLSARSALPADQRMSGGHILQTSLIVSKERRVDLQRTSRALPVLERVGPQKANGLTTLPSSSTPQFLNLCISLGVPRMTGYFWLCTEHCLARGASGLPS